VFSKIIIVGWSAFCFALACKASAEIAGGAAAFADLFLLMLWGAVIVPTALIGLCFKHRKTYSTPVRLIRVGVLVAVAVVAFVSVVRAPDFSDRAAHANYRRENQVAVGKSWRDVQRNVERLGGSR
jgi:Mn2+/Fe2+ NRAMP family transporter